jgi:hypothetical protein
MSRTTTGIETGVLSGIAESVKSVASLATATHALAQAVGIFL